MTFIHTARAYYGQNILVHADYVDEVSIVKAYDDECDWEFNIRWYELGGKVCPRIEVFDDAWRCFFEVQIFELLGACGVSRHGEKSMTPTQFCSELLQMGFIDKTPTQPEYEASIKEPVLERGVWKHIPKSTFVGPGWSVLVLDNSRKILTFGSTNGYVGEHYAGDSVHVLSWDDKEIAMWDHQEWQDEPILVMGAILRCAARSALE